MKAAIFRFFSFCFALLLLAACSRDGEPFLPDDTGKDDGDIPVDIVVSRSTFTGAGDGGETDTKFTPGCHIGVSVDGSAAYQNVQYEYPASGSALVAVGEKIYYRECSAPKVKAYYPYRSDGAYSTAFVEADQSSSDNYYKSDALVANGSISNSALRLQFAHRMAKVIFTFNEDVTDVTILNQSLTTSAVTGNSSIKAYGENARKWKACIVPGQTQLKVTGKKDGRDFKTAFNTGSGLLSGEQYDFNVVSFIDKAGKELWDLSTGSLSIGDDRSYYVTQSSLEATGNNITVTNGAPTIYIDSLNVSAGVALDIKNGNPTVRVVNKNILKSTDYGASGIQLGNDGTSGSIKIVGSGELTAIGGYQGCGIGTIYTANGGWHINIEDCTVTAQANGSYPAGIGSNLMAWCGNITIKNAMITSTGAQFGAGIGSGQKGACGDITITLKQGDTIENFLGRMKGYIKVGGGRLGKCGYIAWH